MDKPKDNPRPLVPAEITRADRWKAVPLSKRGRTDDYLRWITDETNKHRRDFKLGRVAVANAIIAHAYERMKHGELDPQELLSMFEDQ